MSHFLNHWATISVLFSTTSIAYIVFINIDNNRLVSLDYWSAEFEKAALELTRDKETPAAILRVLQTINLMIGHPKGAYFLFHEINSYNVHKFDPATDDIPEDLRNCNVEMKKRLHGPLKRALKAGVIAITYSSIAFGFRARALLAELELVDDVGAFIITHTSEIIIKKSSRSWGSWLGKRLAFLRPERLAHHFR